jgi:hypothetical protein
MFQFLNVEKKRRKLSKNIEERENVLMTIFDHQKNQILVSVSLLSFITVWWR